MTLFGYPPSGPRRPGDASGNVYEPRILETWVKFNPFLYHLRMWYWGKSLKHPEPYFLYPKVVIFFLIKWLVWWGEVGRRLQVAKQDFMVLLGSTLGLKERRYCIKYMLSNYLSDPAPGSSGWGWAWRPNGRVFQDHFFRPSHISPRSGAVCLLVWESSMSYEETLQVYLKYQKAPSSSPLMCTTFPQNGSPANMPPLKINILMMVRKPEAFEPPFSFSAHFGEVSFSIFLKASPLKALFWVHPTERTSDKAQKSYLKPTI